ncbi:MAG: hypothetical protein H0T68_08650 [Gemmatimonadales bacterium]|nr:hypothetical protein [Gemmatimonadales bacterium]
MIRKTWILGSLTAVMLAACGGGADNANTTDGTGMESGAGMSDTMTMAPGAATMDTAMGADTGMADTAATR